MATSASSWQYSPRSREDLWTLPQDWQCVQPKKGKIFLHRTNRLLGCASAGNGPWGDVGNTERRIISIFIYIFMQGGEIDKVAQVKMGRNIKRQFFDQQIWVLGMVMLVLFLRVTLNGLYIIAVCSKLVRWKRRSQFPKCLASTCFSDRCPIPRRIDPAWLWTTSPPAQEFKKHLWILFASADCSKKIFQPLGSVYWSILIAKRQTRMQLGQTKERSWHDRHSNKSWRFIVPVWNMGHVQQDFLT